MLIHAKLNELWSHLHLNLSICANLSGYKSHLSDPQPFDISMEMSQNVITFEYALARSPFALDPLRKESRFEDVSSVGSDLMCKIRTSG